MSEANKLAVILATSLLVIASNMEDTLWLLKRVLYIHYPLCFQKDLYEITALIALDSEVYTMTPTYIAKLDLKVWKTDIRI